MFQPLPVRLQQPPTALTLPLSHRRRWPARRLPVALAAGLLLALALPTAQAQSYRCSSTKGPYYSDRPCPIDGGTRLGSFGPLPEPAEPRRPALSSTAPMVRAPDHLKYMSAECASLNDGIRTAPSRGLAYDTLSELRDTYNRRCSADEAQARRRLADEASGERRASAQKQAQATVETRREESVTRETMAQCAEMRRIIATRNERISTLTPGEVNDLRRFETNYAQRCQNRLP